MSQYIAKAYLSKDGKIVKPEEKVELTTEQAVRLGDKVQAVGEEKPFSLDDLTVNQLKELAEEKGFEDYSKLKKAELIELVDGEETEQE